MNSYLTFILLFALCGNLTGCAYKIGYAQRSLPGGYNRVAIPIFANKTQEVGVEVYFTNALIREFSRSQVATLGSKNEAPVVLEGEIRALEYRPGGNDPTPAEKLTNENNIGKSLLNTEYRVLLSTYIRLRRSSDKKILWEGGFNDEKVYLAPKITIPSLNAANANYNQVVRHQTLQVMAQDLMSEVHNRITENF